ncbi:MAG: DNA primase [Nitrospiraceae bacterium]|nr:MAG: DNA primase [Nitrospiraceae bacterium]
MPSYDNTLQDIKNRLDIVDFISDYINLKKTGQNWKGLCPFHTEKTPSFTVSPAKQIFHCFGCNTGGDIFSFLTRYENLTFPEALNVLAKRAGVELRTRPGNIQKTGEKEHMVTIHKDACAFFEQNLIKSEQSQKYLKGRGIDAHTQKLFSLGYASQSWNALLNYLTRKGHKPEGIKKAGLVSQGSKGYYDTFRNRIIFPIYDLKGDVIAFGGRSIDGTDPKYLNSPETLIFNKRSVLYGLYNAKNAIKESGTALFMEGYMDVITAHVHGISNAVAPLGTAFTQEHGKLIKRFVEDVVLVFDSDQAGIKAAKKAADILLGSGLNVHMLLFPAEEDPDSFLRKHGKEAFQKLLENPLSIIDFLLKLKADRRVLAREAIETISRVPDKVLQGDYVKMLSEGLKINEVFIMEELKKAEKRLSSGYHSVNRNMESRPKAGPRHLDEVITLQLLLQLPDKASESAARLVPEDFRDLLSREIFQKIKQGIASVNELLQHFDEPGKAYITELSMRDDIEDAERALEDCVKKLKENRRKRMLSEINSKIVEAERKKDQKLVTQLQKELQKIRKS